MNQEVKMNLGSGPDGVEGWINYDWGWLPFLGKYQFILKFLAGFKFIEQGYVRKWPGIKLADLRNGIPCEDNSVNWVYSSNFLEHLEKYETKKLLVECLRVMKPGATIRIVVPDLNKLVDKYLKVMDADMFCREFYGFDKDKINGFKKTAIRGHQWMYDEKSLTEILNKVGFDKVTKSKWRKSKMPDVDKLDLLQHKELGLYIEARKAQ